MGVCRVVGRGRIREPVLLEEGTKEGKSERREREEREKRVREES